jgi:hypothetical protein
MPTSVQKTRQKSTRGQADTDLMIVLNSQQEKLYLYRLPTVYPQLSDKAQGLRLSIKCMQYLREDNTKSSVNNRRCVLLQTSSHKYNETRPSIIPLVHLMFRNTLTSQSTGSFFHFVFHSAISQIHCKRTLTSKGKKLCAYLLRWKASRIYPIILKKFLTALSCIWIPHSFNVDSKL